MESAPTTQTDLDANLASHVGEKSHSLIWCSVLEYGDYETQNSTIGNLHRRRVDYGCTIRLDLSLRRELGPSGDSEKNQRAVIHVADALGRSINGDRNGPL